MYRGRRDWRGGWLLGFSLTRPRGGALHERCASRPCCRVGRSCSTPSAGSSPREVPALLVARRDGQTRARGIAASRLVVRGGRRSAISVRRQPTSGPGELSLLRAGLARPRRRRRVLLSRLPRARRREPACRAPLEPHVRGDPRAPGRRRARARERSSSASSGGSRLPFEYRRAVYYFGLALVILIGVASSASDSAPLAGSPAMLVVLAYIAHVSIGLRLPERLLTGSERDLAGGRPS